MAQTRELIPVSPDWRAIVNTLHSHYDSYKRLLDALAKQGVYPDYSTLCHLKCGYSKQPRFDTGAALLNLYAEIK